MVAKMAVILDFTKYSNLLEKLQIFFPRVVQYDRIKHVAAFGSILYVFIHGKTVKKIIFIQKWLDLILLMTSYLISIATDCRQTLEKRVSRTNEQLL